MTRRNLLFGLAGGAAAAVAYPCYLEPRWLEVTRRPVRLATSGPIRLLHLADLHASEDVSVPMIDRAITLGLAEKPDLICITGDFITHREGFDRARYVQALRRLPAAAAAFAVLGNHDGGRWAGNRRGYPDHQLVGRMLEECGIEVLHNRATSYRDLTLIGVGDLWSEEVEAGRAFSAIDRRRPILLLAHNPDSKDILGGYPWDLMLSGHTHGGQVIVPFRGPSYAPVVDKRYVAGLKPWGSRQIHVTRGVGSYGGVRFLCRPEVSLLYLG